MKDEDRYHIYYLDKKREEEEWIYVKGRYGGRVRRKVKDLSDDYDYLPGRNCYE